MPSHAIDLRQAAARVRQSRILFAHQSVGADVLEGLTDLERDHGEPIPVTAFDRRGPPWAGIVSARLGRNGDPRSKTDAFADAVALLAPEIAIQKYCYVDLERQTDAAGLFEFYRDRLARLAKAHPATTFVHMTIPLMATEHGMKAAVKRLLGRPLDHVDDNAARETFNTLMRCEFGDDALFDLAASECSGDRPFSLRKDFTTDGGHLNARGRRHVAAEFLTFLGSVAARPVAAVCP